MNTERVLLFIFCQFLSSLRSGTLKNFKKLFEAIEWRTFSFETTFTNDCSCEHLILLTSIKNIQPSSCMENTEQKNRLRWRVMLKLKSSSIHRTNFKTRSYFQLNQNRLLLSPHHSNPSGNHNPHLLSHYHVTCTVLLNLYPNPGRKVLLLISFYRFITKDLRGYNSLPRTGNRQERHDWAINTGSHTPNHLAS